MCNVHLRLKKKHAYISRKCKENTLVKLPITEYWTKTRQKHQECLSRNLKRISGGSTMLSSTQVPSISLLNHVCPYDQQRAQTFLWLTPHWQKGEFPRWQWASHGLFLCPRGGGGVVCSSCLYCLNPKQNPGSISQERK